MNIEHSYLSDLGVILFLLGMVGNILHDKVLADLRKKQRGYSIPHGLLYEYISYPNYLCEWIEWAGYALYLDQPEGTICESSMLD